jgi:hypothetical protein
MRRSFWPSNRFAFVIPIGLLVCSACIREDATAVKSPRCDTGDCANDAAADTGGADGNSGLITCQKECDTKGADCAGSCALDSDQAAKKEACENHCLETTQSCNDQCASGGQDTPSTGGGAKGGASAGSSGAGAAGTGGARGGASAGSSGAGAAGVGGANGITDVGSCQLACDANGMACVSMCSVSVDRSACESECFAGDQSCDARCASSGLPATSSSDPLSCGSLCLSYDTPCTTLCNMYIDAEVRTACHNHCAEKRVSCERRC